MNESKQICIYLYSGIIRQRIRGALCQWLSINDTHLPIYY